MDHPLIEQWEAAAALETDPQVAGVYHKCAAQLRAIQKLPKVVGISTALVFDPQQYMQQQTIAVLDNGNVYLLDQAPWGSWKYVTPVPGTEAAQ